MHTLSTLAPLTVGKLLGIAFGMCRAHSDVFLCTAAIFYLPLVLLSFFFVRDLISTTLFSLVVLPGNSLVRLSDSEPPARPLIQGRTSFLWGPGILPARASVEPGQSPCARKRQSGLR